MNQDELLAATFAAQLERIAQKLRPDKPHATGPQKPTMSETEYGEK